MNDRDNAFLGTEPVGGLLFRLAVPTITAQVINMLYNVVDRIYIGHMGPEGDMALTGVGVCMPIIMFVSAFAALISSGGAPEGMPSTLYGIGGADHGRVLLGAGDSVAHIDGGDTFV